MVTAHTADTQEYPRRILGRGGHGLGSLSGSLAATLLITAVFFNAVLSAINAHVIQIDRTEVVFAEVVISAAVAVLVTVNWARDMRPWLVLSLFVVSMGVVLALGNDAFTPKYIRDVLEIPLFIMLGMVYRDRNLLKLLCFIQTVVFTATLIEALTPNLYAWIFDIAKYYVNTRDFAQESFWTDSTLFISAFRPSDRFFGFVDIHRLSSVFLEPVSLGNYCVIITACVLSFWREMTPTLKAYMVFTTVLILIGSDGRLAAVTCALLLATSFVFPYLPRFSNALYLPLALLSGLVAALLFRGSVGDDFQGRLVGSMQMLSSLDVTSLFGLDAQSATDALDSGISYFVMTQSFIGVFAIWLFIALLPGKDSDASTIYLHSICMFISLTLLVSYSIFSVKIASLMWFVYGYVYRPQPISLLIKHHKSPLIAR